MKGSEKFAELLGSYGAYHRDPRNKFFHFLGVPIVTFSILIPMAWLRLGWGEVTLTGASLFVGIVTAYYFWLDWKMALGILLLILPLVYGANAVGALALAPSAKIFGGSFVLGWIFQLTGHYFEGNRPALTDNLWQVFSAPLFLAAEVAFLLGFRKDLHSRVA